MQKVVAGTLKTDVEGRLFLCACKLWDAALETVVSARRKVQACRRAEASKVVGENKKTKTVDMRDETSVGMSGGEGGRGGTHCWYWDKRDVSAALHMERWSSAESQEASRKGDTPNPLASVDSSCPSVGTCPAAAAHLGPLLPPTAAHAHIKASGTEQAWRVEAVGTYHQRDCLTIVQGLKTRRECYDVRAVIQSTHVRREFF